MAVCRSRSKQGGDQLEINLRLDNETNAEDIKEQIAALQHKLSLLENPTKKNIATPNSKETSDGTYKRTRLESMEIEDNSPDSECCAHLEELRTASHSRDIDISVNGTYASGRVDSGADAPIYSDSQGQTLQKIYTYPMFK